MLVIISDCGDLQSVDDVGAGGAGVGGSAATGNVNGNGNTGAQGGNGVGGTGVNNGRRLRQQVPLPACFSLHLCNIDAMSARMARVNVCQAAGCELLNCSIPNVIIAVACLFLAVVVLVIAVVGASSQSLRNS